MKLRQGRKVGRTLYYQVGPEPSDADKLIGIVDTTEDASMIVAAVNQMHVRVFGCDQPGCRCYICEPSAGSAGRASEGTEGEP